MSLYFLGTHILTIKSIYFSHFAYRSTYTYLTVLKSKGLLSHISRCLLHDESKENDHFKPFLEIIKDRQNQAKRSIVVQVQSAKSCTELYSHCSRFGNIKEMLHYKAGKESMHFIIVEFSKESSVKKVMNSCQHIEDTHIVPVESTFLWFKASNKNSLNKQANTNVPLTVENGNYTLPDKDLKNRLQFCDNISDQIMMLYNSTKLNDLGTRLRFLTARQIEVALSGLFPSATAFPFGSSVNGFGKMNCDLDVVLQLSKNTKHSDESRLMYHCKAGTGSERLASQRHMEAIGDLIHLFLPGCSQVRKILQARVPIIKYYQQLTDIECDLSMSNMSGVHMSDLLHIWGSMDKRVRPLMFIIKKWAQEVGLTNDFPGRWITNFSLTLLVLAFLQSPSSSSPIIPSLNMLIKCADRKDKHVTEDGIECTFLRDINKLHFKTQNTDPLESLLIQFFEHYSSFDFSSKAICLNQAAPITKPEHSPLYIVNPLERGLNVSRNVSLEELERFRLEIRNAAWTLESQEKKTESWGILSLFENRSRQFPPMVFPMSMKRNNRLMDVTKLFDDDEAKENKNGDQRVEIKMPKDRSEGINKESDSIKGMSEIRHKTAKTSEVKNTKIKVKNFEDNNYETLNVQVKRKTGS